MLCVCSKTGEGGLHAGLLSFGADLLRPQSYMVTDCCAGHCSHNGERCVRSLLSKPDLACRCQTLMLAVY